MEHRGHRARVKSRFLAEGLDGFAEHEVLELLLFYAKPQGDVNPLAHALIERFGSVTGVLDADYHLLAETPGVGEHTATLLHMMPQVFRYYAKTRYKEKPALRGVRDAIQYCINLFHGLNTEHLFMVCLNAQHRLLRTVLLHEGTVDRVSIYPREVVRAAMASHAQAILLTHNHPGGSLTISEADVLVTGEIVNALRPLDIDVLDHIIVADGKGASLCRGFGLSSLNYMQDRPRLAADPANHARARRMPPNEIKEDVYEGERFIRDHLYEGATFEDESEDFE